MKHFGKMALLGSTAAMERKSGEDDGPEGMVTKALEALTTSVNKRLDDLEKKSDTTKIVERLDKLEAKSNRPAGGQSEGDQPSIERKAFGSYLRFGAAAPADELKALMVANDTQGGYLAPAEMSTEFIRDLIEFSPIRSVASVRATVHPSVKYPKRTGVTNAKWGGETQAQEGSQPSFGQVEVPVHELTTFVDMSNILMQDSAGVAESEVRLALAEDFGKKEGLGFVSGSGVNMPEGLLTNAEIPYTPSGHADILNSATALALIALMHALPATYRNAGAWFMNGTTLGKVRSLKDGDGRFLWQPSYAAGQPETILGRPVVEVPDMPDPTADTFPILFGDGQGYRIVDRLDLSILVNPYLLATNGMTRIHATRRVGGRVIQPARFRKLKIATS